MMEKSVNSPAKLGYLPALDGLRAVAVLMVMLLHAHFQFGKGGGIGVDLFFALSGFLITTLLLEEHSANNFISLLGFYIRRTFRLFPAVYFMLLVILLYASLYTVGITKENIHNEILASSLYVNNISYMWGVTPMFLGHTWSLGVEEQFYLVWPLLLILALKYFSIDKLILALLVFIPLIWILKSLHYFPILSGLIHESIFIGCLFALLRWESKIPIKIPNFISVMLFLLLLFIGLISKSIYHTFITYDLRFIGGFISIFIIIGMVENPKSLLNRLLSFRGIVYIGKISYALYLWHVPVFKWFLMYSALPSFISFVCKFLVTFILAILSLELIEKKSVLIGRRLSAYYINKSLHHKIK